MAKHPKAVFLFSNLGMETGSFKFGKFMHKVENWVKLRSMKSAMPISKHS